MRIDCDSRDSKASPPLNLFTNGTGQLLDRPAVSHWSSESLADERCNPRDFRDYRDNHGSEIPLISLIALIRSIYRINHDIDFLDYTKM